MHHFEYVLEEAFLVLGVLVIELGQIAPHHLFLVLEGKGMGDPALGLPFEPGRVFLRQGRVHRAVADHQVHHHLETQLFSGPGPGPHLLPFALLAPGGKEQGVDFEVVLDGIQAAGFAGLLDRIDEYPIKPHAGGPLQMRLPVRHRSGQGGKEVVDKHLFS